MRTMSHLASDLPRTFRLAVLALGVAVPACSDPAAVPAMPDVNAPAPAPNPPPPSDSSLDPPTDPATPPLGAGQLDVPTEVMGTETPVSAKYWPLGVPQGVPTYTDGPIRALITSRSSAWRATASCCSIAVRWTSGTLPSA